MSAHITAGLNVVRTRDRPASQCNAPPRMLKQPDDVPGERARVRGRGEQSRGAGLDEGVGVGQGEAISPDQPDETSEHEQIVDRRDDLAEALQLDRLDTVTPGRLPQGTASPPAAQTS
jgi:hypothetical protein